MEKNILLSICIPTYNRSDKLYATLQLCVSGIDTSGVSDVVEVLIGDNASTDRTEVMCFALTQKYSFVKYIKNKKNIGCESNWLNLCSLAKGKYVWILSDDDFFLKELIYDIIELVKTNDFAVIFCNYTIGDASDKSQATVSRCKAINNISGYGMRSYFIETGFSNSFLSSNVYNRQLFLSKIAFISSYKSTSWLQLYASKELLGEKEGYYIISTPKISMSSLSHSATRRNAYSNGFEHFYMNAHLEFIEFLCSTVFAKDKEVLCSFGDQLSSQIVIEKITWYELTHRNDYLYWVKYLISILNTQYYNRSIKFWFRDIFVMLSPAFVISFLWRFYTKAAPQFILYVKSGQYSPNVLRKILYFMFLIYKGKGTRNSFKDTRIE